jgi:hypothetical protein
MVAARQKSESVILCWRHSATNAAAEQLKVGPLLGGFRCGTSIVSPRPSNATVTLTANRQATMASCVIGKSPKPKTTSRRSVFSASREQERGRLKLGQPTKHRQHSWPCGVIDLRGRFLMLLLGFWSLGWFAP